jgi:hypothetical protein
MPTLMVEMNVRALHILIITYKIAAMNKEEFNKLADEVSSAMADPWYREYLNSHAITHASLDGQMPYPRSRFMLARRLEIQDEIDSLPQDPSDMSIDIYNALVPCTANFSHAGTASISGDQAFLIVDACLLTLYEDGFDSDDLGTLLEASIAGNLWRNAGLPFASYQINLDVSGQGLIRDTYEIKVHFSPIPKNVTED